MRQALYLLCRNILALTNHFDVSDQNITVENYVHWFEYLNQTFPDQVASLHIRHCDLKTFLDQVCNIKNTSNLVHCILFGSFT